MDVPAQTPGPTDPRGGSLLSSTLHLDARIGVNFKLYIELRANGRLSTVSLWSVQALWPPPVPVCRVSRVQVQ